jgi:hypothetical protein
MGNKVKEVKAKVNKCKYCTGIIEDVDLGIYPQLDMKRNLKYKKNTKGEFRKDKLGDLILVEFKAHKQCHEKKEAERIAWTNLYEYVREEYFEKIVPIGAVTRLADLRNGSSRLGKIIHSKQGYSYDLILECFEEFEGEIKKYITTKDFGNDTQKANYLMTIVESKIDGFEGKKEAALEKDVSEVDFINQLASKTNFEEKQKTISFEDSEDYDILG